MIGSLKRPSLSVRLIMVMVFFSRGSLTSAQCQAAIDKNDACVANLEQVDNCNLLVDVYEDCAVGSSLYTIDGTGTTVSECEGTFGGSGATVVLNAELDAEGVRTSFTCGQVITLADGTQYSVLYTVLDVDETPPSLVGTDPAETLYMEENNDVGYELLSVTLTDTDYGETQTMQATLQTSAVDTFAIARSGPCDDPKCTEVVFSLTVSKSLDYETGVFYEINIDFTSTDARGDGSSTSLKVLLFLNDTSDSAPFWLTNLPSAEFEESESPIDNIFTVEARDRDTAVNNEICYRIDSGNEDGYFAIDEVTGVVSCPGGIDREALDSTAFQLELVAFEVLGGDCANEAPPPNDVTQVTSVRVLDVNDNSPTFGENVLTFTMSELTSGDVLTTATFNVTDLDEGTAGSYTLTSSDPDHLGFDIDSGSGITDFVLKAIYVEQDNIFDFEKMTDGNYDLSFVVTATEDAEATHTNTLAVTITLEDVNDVSPVFEQEAYNISLLENSAVNTLVITVQATDGDASPDFGTPSIRYFLSQCTEYFAIDTETGEITVATDTALDYEQVQEISCSLEARDRTGASPYLFGTAALVVSLEDVDDTPPVLTVQDATVSEGVDVGTAVTAISVRDEDTQAAVSFSIEYKDGTADIVKSWFTITSRDCNVGEFGDFCADLVVDSELDREVEEEVSLTIVATDDNTETNEPSDTVVIVVTLEDVNDVAPSFCDNCTDSLSVYENDVAGTQIAKICADDPDLGDVLTYSSSGSDQVTIDPDSGVLSVVEPLDREVEPTVTVTITVTDAVNHNDSVEATITVKDRNDNAPVLTDGLCETPYTVSEAAANGTVIVVATATDPDEGAHAKVSFGLRSAQAGIASIPFSVDPLSGEISVSLHPEDLNVLDREQQDEWLLQLQAYDNCELNEAFCEIKVASCIITVNVGDVNDNAPYLDPAREIYAGEELKANEEVPDSTITARDKDLLNTEATEIHYEVTKFVNLGTGEELDPAFFADDFNETDGSGNMLWSCKLHTTVDLTHMAGAYNLTVLATDGPLGGSGNQADLFISLEITDANDYTPVINFEGCLVEMEQYVIISEEMYGGGDYIPCYDEGPLIEMTYTDEDADAPNNQAIITVDYNSSDVYGGPGQLEFFEMTRVSSRWRLHLKDNVGNLSLEEAQAYNLSLKVEDQGTPTLFSFDWIFLNLTPVSEYDPNFCEDVADCYATTYILEETTDIGGFREAEDEDNAGAIYDTIYYYIVGGEASKFYIPDSTVPEVEPYSELDRDDGPGQYTLLLRATNSRQSPPDVGGDVPLSTDMLQLTVVLIDQNDNPPVFNTSIIYGSVLQSGSTDQLAAILVASDKDLNETLEYERVSDMTWDPDENYGDDVFEVLDDTELGYVWLRRDPSSLSGYCLFTAQVNDRNKEEHQDTVLVQIFIVESQDEVPFRFKNDIATLQDAQDDIEAILTATFGYQAFVDSMATTGGSDNTTRDSVVEVHFVNGSRTLRAASDGAGNIVPPNVIESMASSALTSSQLQAAMADIGLELYQVGDAAISDEDSLEAQLLTYQIVLGVVTIVLLSIVFLVATAYCVRTNKLERRVKVLTTNTFGSQSSGLNKAGVAAAPNSNLFKGEGTNPIFNISLQEFNNQDARSISSGDSVLVGVEDNPEFRDYKADRGQSSKTDTPAVVGADGITSNNPLFSVQPSAPAGSTDGSDAGSYKDGDLGVSNSNFLFQ